MEDKIDRWIRKQDELQTKVTDAIIKSGQEPLVYYSAYESEEDGSPIDNTDEVAIKGKVKMVQSGCKSFGNGNHYSGSVLENPTWLDLAVEANRMILTTEDRHHCFFEEVEKRKVSLMPTDGSEIVHCYKFIMGS
jgi:hypothetical protein